MAEPKIESRKALFFVWIEWPTMVYLHQSILKCLDYSSQRRKPMRIHYLQHVAFENPGSILHWAEKNECRLTASKLYENDQLPEVEDFDWLVVMGGPMNIYEEEKYSWLAKEKELIRNAIEAQKVVLGICLGSQLIADVIGAKVVKNPLKEIGWFPIELTEAAKDLPLFENFPDEPMVFHWHGDTFVDLPKEAKIIAQSAGCANQGFIFKDRVIGFQFHLENTEAIIADLILNCGEEMIEDVYVQGAQMVRGQKSYIVADNRLMEAFLDALKKRMG
jgi:GMP synthase-like glutamine amidotransferase